MATGFIAQATKYNLYRLIDATTATTAVPSAIDDGIDISGLFGTFTKIDNCVAEVWSSAGSVTMTGTFRLWGYNAITAKWFPTGTGTGAAKGTINAGAAIDETGTDLIRHAEPVYLLSCFDRVYAQCTAIGGTATALTFDLCVPREAA